jgi:ADP-ribose pyrophosphatase YjhB (NUDIX family)
MIEGGRVHAVRYCAFTLVPGGWDYARRHASAIARHWSVRQQQNPKMFNGWVFVLREHRLAEDKLEGVLVATDFASYLYWRERGFDDGQTCEAFANIFLRGECGGYLVARAAVHTLNGGLFVAPGGMLDERDVDTRGGVDIVTYALRELAEETGLQPAEVAVEGGFHVFRDGAQLSIGIVGRALMGDAAVLARVGQHNGALAAPELGGAVWWRDAAPTARDMPSTVAATLRALFAQ